MKIELHQIPIRELLEGYKDNEYNGVSTQWTGKELGKESNAAGLNIRPPYQREFIYPAEKQQSVINTVRHGYPLNVMYWVKIRMAHLKFLMDSKGYYLYYVL